MWTMITCRKSIKFKCLEWCVPSIRAVGYNREYGYIMMYFLFDVYHEIPAEHCKINIIQNVLIM
jgi:hypothetical protein